CRFALSLNATTDDVRARLMPHAAAAPIADLLAVLRERAAASPGERFFITYVLWAGVNDSPADAERLIALLKELPAHINLIPHNPLPGGDYRPPPRETILRFAEQVQSAGVRCLVRPQRGAEIAAACGQLARSCVSMA
ncbi:MAG: 23S rRNA (adenine(2503)-C(2))-methyltransferase RlmN, partial [Vicinamibacteria bacterium]|nr:23S rRNA (adenine(2503)-C(2))-methyltransferase RlmN [Vicinamibacteria bacterium]